MQLDAAGRRIETFRTGWILQILGAIFAGVGVLLGWMILTGGHGVTVNGRPADRGDVWLPILIAAIGLAIAGYRGRTVIDLGNRLRIRHRRWWGRVRVLRDPLGDPRHVMLRTERRGSGKNSRTVYAVYLVTASDQHELTAVGGERAGRLRAEAAARFCGVPLHDRRGGTELVRQPEDLDRSVVDVAEADSPVARPEPCRVRVERGAVGMIVRVPSATAWLLPLMLIPMGFPLGFFVLFWWPNVEQSAPFSIGWLLFVGMPLAMCALPAVVIVVVAAGSGFFPRRVSIERGVLRIGRRSFPAGELEELHVSRGSVSFSNHLRAASDRRTARMGRGLSLAELEYARHVILDALRRSR